MGQRQVEGRRRFEGKCKDGGMGRKSGSGKGEVSKCMSSKLKRKTSVFRESSSIYIKY